MANIFRNWYTLPIPEGAESIDVKGVPSARFRKKGKLKTVPLTDDGKRLRVESPAWYGWVEGKAVKLFTDAVASQQRLAELLRKSELRESGILDPFEEHRKRPLAEHVQDWAANLRDRGKGEKHVDATAACVMRILAACKFDFTADISASRLERYLGDLRRDAPAFAPLDRDKEWYTKGELASRPGHQSIGGCIADTPAPAFGQRQRQGATLSQSDRRSAPGKTWSRHQHQDQ